MEALGLKAQSSIQTYDGMRRVDMVCITEASICMRLADSDCWTSGNLVLFLFASSESLENCPCFAVCTRRNTGSSAETSLCIYGSGEQEGGQEADGKAAGSPSPLFYAYKPSLLLQP